MRQVNMHEAKTHLSRLVEAAERGEGFIIARAGRPAVKVVRLDEGDAPPPRRLGFLEGAFVIPDDFDSMGGEDITALFEGESKP